MKTILVTGGAGFIGSNLCKYLIENNNEVICLDNFITGRCENLKDIIDSDLFTLIEGDITDSIEIDNLDEIYN